MTTKKRGGTPKRTGSARSSNPSSLGTSGLLVNRLLFSIIAAHPSSTEVGPQRRLKEQRSRLAAARLALLGEKMPREIDDFDALYFMALWYSQDRKKIWGIRLQSKLKKHAPVDFQCRSIRELAKKASEFSVSTGTKKSTEDRLRNKFARHKKYLLDVVDHADDVEATIEDQVLRQVAALLQNYLAMDVEARLGRPEKKPGRLQSS